MNEDGMAAALCIIIIHGHIRRGQIKRESCTQIALGSSLDKKTPKLWGLPCRIIYRKSSIFYNVFLRMDKETFAELLGLLTLFISGMCLPLPFRSTLFHPQVFSGVRVTRSLVLYVCFVDRCLPLCTFSIGHCVVCSSSIYGFWLPLWYLQTLLCRNALLHLTHPVYTKF
jgi:hypothetical protein